MNFQTNTYWSYSAHHLTKYDYLCAMKTTAILIFTLLLGSSAHAQFNTILPRQARYNIERIIEDEITAGDKTTAADSRQTAQSDTIGYRKKWIRQYLSVSYPLKSIYITSPYGIRQDPFTGKKATHNGLDLRANNAEAYAMMFGEVIKVGSDKRSGTYVTIRHGDYTVSYCHLSQPLVKKKQLVSAGEPIAITGNTGRSTAPHLHLTLRKGRKTINPIVILDFIQDTRQEAVEELKKACP